MLPSQAELRSIKLKLKHSDVLTLRLIEQRLHLSVR